MNSRFIIMLIIALIFASIAALIAKVWIGNQAKNNNIEIIQVIIADKEIPFGVKLEEIHIKAIDWPSDDVPSGSFGKVEDVIGKIVKNKFYPGELITERRIAEHLGGSTLSSLVRQDSRAVSIRVDDVMGVAGFILPGNHVDVLMTETIRTGTSKKSKSKTILENIKVLAVDQEASPDNSNPSVVRAVTLELRPNEAEIITAAQQQGKIQLSLRNPLDSSKFIREHPKPIKKIIKKSMPKVNVVPW